MQPIIRRRTRQKRWSAKRERRNAVLPGTRCSSATFAVATRGAITSAATPWQTTREIYARTSCRIKRRSLCRPVSGCSGRTGQWNEPPEIPPCRSYRKRRIWVAILSCRSYSYRSFLSATKCPGTTSDTARLPTASTSWSSGATRNWPRTWRLMRCLTGGLLGRQIKTAWKKRCRRCPLIRKL